MNLLDLVLHLDAHLVKLVAEYGIWIYAILFAVIFSETGTDPDRRNYIVSNQRLREAGFEASRSLDYGIQELLKGYRMMVSTEFRNA